MTKIYIIILTLFLIPKGTETCSCAPLPHWKKATPKEYEYAKEVFIGDVTVAENQTDYKIVICEVFKGNLKAGQILNGKNIGTCGPYVDKNGEWVLFGELSIDFKVNDCGLSSNIAEPRELLPPPPPPKSGIDYKNLIEELKVEAKKNIREQIKMLREMANSE